MSSCLILGSLAPFLPSACLPPLASALASLPILHVIQCFWALSHINTTEKLLDQVGGGRLRAVHLDQVSTPELHFRLFRAEYVDWCMLQWSKCKTHWASIYIINGNFSRYLPLPISQKTFSQTLIIDLRWWSIRQNCSEEAFPYWPSSGPLGNIDPSG